MVASALSFIVLIILAAWWAYYGRPMGYLVGLVLPLSIGYSKGVVKMYRLTDDYGDLCFGSIAECRQEFYSWLHTPEAFSLYRYQEIQEALEAVPHMEVYGNILGFEIIPLRD